MQSSVDKLQIFIPGGVEFDRQRQPAGRWRIGNDAGRTEAEAELELDIADLGSAYLGAFDFGQLAEAQRIRELTPGALQRASDLLRTPRPPFCPEDF